MVFHKEKHIKSKKEEHVIYTHYGFETLYKAAALFFVSIEYNENESLFQVEVNNVSVILF